MLNKNMLIIYKYLPWKRKYLTIMTHDLIKDDTFIELSMRYKQ